jgi:hypothetical protein
VWVFRRTGPGTPTGIEPKEDDRARGCGKQRSKRGSGGSVSCEWEEDGTQHPSVSSSKGKMADRAGKDAYGCGLFHGTESSFGGPFCA